MQTVCRVWIAGLALMALAGCDGKDGPKPGVVEGSFTNRLGMTFVAIPAGRFMMGCDATIGDACQPLDPPLHEVPRHAVQVAAFYLQTTEVTQAQWQAVMQHNPSRLQGPDLPVESLSWHDAQAFIQRLNQKEGCTRCYRLPSEAQWEYAYRAGSQTIWPQGNDSQSLQGFAHYGASTEQPVGRLQPSAWGLYDMGGNLWEWVADCWHDSYEGAPADGSAWDTLCGPQEFRVVRGGSWNSSDAITLRAALRNGHMPGNRRLDVGLRVAFVPEG